MKILVCGGDGRGVLLSGMLAQAGHEVSCLCMDKAELPDGCRRVSAPEPAEAVIFPVPAVGADGLLNAPFCAAPCAPEHILDSVGAGALILGGNMSAKLVNAAARRGQTARDYMRSPEFTAKNAAVTAEGAISELMRSTPRALADMRILVVGWGRIGKLLIARLAALCPSVYLMSASPESRALAQMLGTPALPPDCPAELLQGFDAVINTAPAPVIPQLCAFREGCLLLELASAPGGISADEALAAGLNCSVLRGLPGRYAPESAARAIFRAVSDILRESGIND